MTILQSLTSIKRAAGRHLVESYYKDESRWGCFAWKVGYYLAHEMGWPKHGGYAPQKFKRS